MTIRDRKDLRQTAGRRLQAASYRPNRLVLIHSGITLAAGLLVAVVQYILQQQMNTHSGLSGLETRAILETAAAALSVIVMILQPFWSMGIIYAALRIARGKSAYPHTLFEGFRRFGPVLRLNLMLVLIYGILTFGAMYTSSMLFMFTPTGAELSEQLMSMALTGEYTDYYQLVEAIPPQMMAQLYRVVIPIFAVVAAVVLVPAFYRMRMASYVLMDQYGTGAWKAIRTSNRMMKRKGVALFKLDLSFWWYYLLSAVLTLPLYADLLLEALEIRLPVEGALFTVICSAVYTVLMLVLESTALPKVMTTYALAYDALLEETPEPSPQPPQYTHIYQSENEE